MSHIVDYSKSAAPSFDAVKDIQDWLGDRYDVVAAEMRQVQNRDAFRLACSFLGVRGFPVQAWYDHFHGGGAWDRESA